ncbi:MAG: ATP-binding protein [Fidelibacterota bacterium]
MRLDLNRILKLQIRGKLAIAFAGLSILPVLVVGFLGISSNVKSMRQMAFETLGHDLLSIKERLGSFFQGMEDNLHFLTSSSSFDHVLEALRNEDKGELQAAIAEFMPELEAFAGLRNTVYQIKFIHRDGDEVFGLERWEDGYRRLSDNELNQKGTQFYLYLARQIPPNSATFIPVELQRRGTSRLLPAVSTIYPVYRPDLVGILVCQIYAEAFFGIVEQEPPHGPPGTVMLVNAEGYYLYHSEKKKDWNRLLASKETANLVADYGTQLADTILASAADGFHETRRQMVAHSPLFERHSGMGSVYTILKSVPREEFFAPVQRFKGVFVGLLALFLLGSLFLSYVATQQFTRPVQKLRQEAEVIAGGDYHSRVDVHTYDEIEDLAHQFNIMAQSLEKREEQIARHRDELERKVRLRTRELEDEKDKLQAILDNVPSGFILLDRDFRIQSASAALQAITGKPVGDLVGHPCYQVVGDGDWCSNCPSRRVFGSGKMETQVVQRVEKDGKERYLEHVSVPLTKNGQVESVLEIITDITERKRLQDQLVRSERLAATGEIAAVIAHEMRNSVTSVRMILQLLSENRNLADTDRESLDVALDSLGRMERVVRDLLDLGRPTRLERRPEDCNEILRSSITFATHQMGLPETTLRIDLDPSLPTVMLDRDRIKEAMVNLILNASQATEGGGTIAIRSRRLVLNRELRDLGEMGDSSGEAAELGIQEIVLPKGSEVLQIDVSDTGRGIPPEHLGRVFDPFFTTKVNGTGLGLSFVKRVVNQHGGIVTASSQVGKGSRFTVFIPVENERENR